MDIVLREDGTDDDDEADAESCRAEELETAAGSGGSGWKFGRRVVHDAFFETRLLLSYSNVVFELRVNVNHAAVGG